MNISQQSNRYFIKHSNNEYLNKVLASHAKRTFINVSLLTPSINTINTNWLTLIFADIKNIEIGKSFELNSLSELKINIDCSICISGTISCEFANGKNFNVGITINDILYPIFFSNLGQGTGKAVTVSADLCLKVNKNDLIKLVVNSNDYIGDLIVLNSNVTVQYLDLIV